jgi:hypothetical protein
MLAVMPAKLILIAPLLYLAVVMILEPVRILKLAPEFLEAVERWRGFLQGSPRWDWTRSPGEVSFDSAAAQRGMRVGGVLLALYCLAQFLI